MTTYAIDFADPLRTGFSIPQGGFNGPGGPLSNSTLRLYGRGAVEWGEAVNENLVRIAENFAGATPPTIPLAGQLWLRQALYVKNGANFFRWNVDGGVWDALAVTTTAGTIGAFGAGSAIGQYVYSTADAKLYRWDSAYKQATAAWLERSLTVQGTNPTVQVPKQALTVYDEYAGDWIVPPSSNVGDVLPPAGAYTGELFYDTSTGTLYIWNSTETAWQQILGPSDTGTGSTESSGDLDMVGSYRVINMLDPVNPQDAATRSWTITEINNRAVNVTGDTMAGTLTMGIGFNIDLNNQRVLNVQSTPVAATDAVNSVYVNAQISSAITALGITGSVVSLIPTPVGGDSGDISISGGIAYVNVAGTWRQFWPAQYS